MVADDISMRKKASDLHASLSKGTGPVLFLLVLRKYAEWIANLASR